VTCDRWRCASPSGFYWIPTSKFLTALGAMRVVLCRSDSNRRGAMYIIKYEYAPLYNEYMGFGPTYSNASPISSQVLAIARNSWPSRRNRSDLVSFFLVPFVTRVDFRVGRGGGCVGGTVTLSNSTHTDPLATVFLRFPIAWGGSKETSIAAIWPMASASVVE
jgi:hypothetical protein